MSTLITPLVLVLLRAVAVMPAELPPAQALVHGVAAVLASSSDVSPEELIRIARHESGFWMDARPGMQHWPHDAAKFPHLRHYVCGLLQMTARTPAECVAWQRSVPLAYMAAADQMRTWHATCRRWGRRGSRRYRCARAGYALGVEAALSA